MWQFVGLHVYIIPPNSPLISLRTVYAGLILPSFVCTHSCYDSAVKTPSAFWSDPCLLSVPSCCGPSCIRATPACVKPNQLWCLHDRITTSNVRAVSWRGILLVQALSCPVKTRGFTVRTRAQIPGVTRTWGRWQVQSPTDEWSAFFLLMPSVFKMSNNDADEWRIKALLVFQNSKWPFNGCGFTDEHLKTLLWTCLIQCTHPKQPRSTVSTITPIIRKHGNQN